MSIQIYVEGTPVAKGRPRFSIIAGHVNAYTDKKTRDYENRIKQAALVAMMREAPIEGPVTMRVMVTLEPPASWSKKKRLRALTDVIRPVTRPDADNYAKAAIDACNKIVFKDDSQITDLTITKRYGPKAQLVIIADSVDRIREAASL